MAAVLYDLGEVRRFFDAGAVKRGIDYYMKSNVVGSGQNIDGSNVYGSVRGSNGERYNVVVHIYENQDPKFYAECTCYVQTDCKHAVALLFTHWFQQMDQRIKREGDDVIEGDVLDAAGDFGSGATVNQLQTEHWLKEIETELSSAPRTKQKNLTKRRKTTPEKHMLYIIELHLTSLGKMMTVNYASARKLKSGGYGQPSTYDPHYFSNYGRTSYMSSDDEAIIREIYVRHMMDGIDYSSLSESGGGEILSKMLATGRCFWEDKDGAALTLGSPQKGIMHWRTFDDATQQLEFAVENADVLILPTTPPFYLNASTLECGPLEIDVPEKALNLIQRSPRISPDAVSAVTKRLSKVIENLPQPVAMKVKNKTDIKPVPCLYFTLEDEENEDSYGYTEPVPVIEITLDYDGKEISLFERGVTVSYVEGDQLVTVKRNLIEEKKHLDLIASTVLKQLNQALYYKHAPQNLFIIPYDGHNSEQDQWIAFILEELPLFREKGWHISYDDEFPYCISEVDEWHMDVEDNEGSPWFELELGIIVDDVEYNLIQLIMVFIKQNPRLFKKMQTDGVTPPENILIRLSENKILTIPFERIARIVNVLVELFDKNPGSNNIIKIPKWRAAELTELQSQGLDWQGSEALKKSAAKLANFKGIKPKAPPKKFKATLRDYQKDGLAWLQFLREYNFHGVLADDMGLGKTVQALAHISAEKAAGRLKQPVLVIAPTSLMYNWRHETEQFAPHLKILTLHGPNRKQHFDEITDHDIVLTTYPLLGRDDKVLLPQQWHMVVLDEAQNIKNSKAKATKIACQLKANHRLCLTGTPMENHLGELWSMFHFLMPGLLGNEKQFRQLFRNPIEKQGDSDRAKRLAKRLSPFMLRRKKDEVAKELPAKTEIVRSVELEGVQRDLYETVRISMQKKVRDSISKLGMGKSHIIVLDALLKLRQICCDPRLLKTNEKAKKANSAKFDLLMSLLPELLEEGRKILLFSQFTSMLLLIEDELSARKIKYVKLTGSTRNREKPIDTFQKGEVPLFLISLKAGGTGLNLTTADTVIHYDPWWNPAVEAQATDRAHRIGQKNPVFVYKLLTEGTVEARIQDMQETKRKLAEGLFDNAGKGKLPDAKSLEALFEPL